MNISDMSLQKLGFLGWFRQDIMFLWLSNMYSTNSSEYARFEVLIMVLLKFEIFWDVMLCVWLSNSCCFRGLYWLHLHDEGTTILPNICNYLPTDKA